MDVAVRSYLTAGVAVFGASAIALAPIQVTPPNLHLAQDRALSALADVSLSSLSDVIQAINNGWNGVKGGLNALNGAADTAITQLGDALQAALISGIGSGNTAVQSIVDGLLDGGSALAQAVDNAVAQFGDPQVFINALVQAFTNVNVNLGLALQAALNVSIQGAADLAAAIEAGGAALAAAFNAAVAAFPSPADFAAALTAALSAVNPTLGILANALTTFTGQLNETLQAGIAAGLTGFQALLNALSNPASALFAAFQAALAAFPNPQAFFNALVEAFGNIDVNLGLALQAVINATIDGPQAFLEALVSGGAALAAAFNAALANFPSPAAFVAALNGALAAINPTLGVLATAFTNFTGQLADTLQAGIAAGLTGFQALLNALSNPASALFAAFQAALAAFPNPQAFFNALVEAFGNIDVNLGLALQAVINATINGPQAFLNALIQGGAALAAAFNAALANFPSPQAFVDAFTGALAALNPTLGILANAFTTFTGQLATTLQAGIAAGLTGFQALLDALGNPASALYAAFQAALAAFPNPEAFFNALVQAFSNIDVNLGLALQAALSLGVDGLQGFIDALVSGGATLAAAFNAALANFPSPAAFVAALNGALAAINPTLGVLANALTTFTGQLADTLQAGIAAGLTGFQALLNALGNPASALFAAFQAALNAFPNPQAFINALVQAFGSIDVNLGLALQAVLNAAIDGPQAFLNALIQGGAALAAAFNAALANFPSPQAFVDAFVGALAAINPTLGVLANAFTTFTGQLADTIQAGIAAGLTGFQALLDALGNPASALFAALQAAIAAFPNPQAFFNALVQAFSNIDVNLGLALQAIINATIDGPQAFINALVSGGAALAAAFNAALANFPSPAEFVAALNGALAAINPTLGVLANAFTTFTGQLADTIQAGIAAGVTGFQALLDALGNPASALFAAFQAALAAFPNPQAFINALVDAFGNIDANLGLALQLVLNAAIDGPQAFIDALVSGGAALAAAFNAALANFPSPEAFVAALNNALGAINPALGILANAFTTFTGQVADTIQAGIAAGVTGFQALLDALGNPASALYAAFQAALAAFPNPQAFINALVDAFSNIDVNLGLALQAVLNLNLDGAQAIINALANGGAQLAAAFNAALANFPSPAAFVDALTGVLGGGLDTVLAAGQQLFNNGAAVLQAGLEAGVAAGNQLIDALRNGLVVGGTALNAAINAALAAFPTPEAVVNALATAGANFAAGLNSLVKSINASLGINISFNLGGIHIGGGINAGAGAAALAAAGAAGAATVKSVNDSVTSIAGNAPTVSLKVPDSAPAPATTSKAAPSKTVSAPSLPKLSLPAPPKLSLPAPPKLSLPAPPKVSLPAPPKVSLPSLPKPPSSKGSSDSKSDSSAKSDSSSKKSGGSAGSAKKGAA
ncbi:hypothetical protein FHT40_002575 [Mycolicibacterium sp. BK556]|uniref:hypothetical protein n=1 Tax=unclassified Mycolicibacterium TaxID=2636767 RepID=UPI001622B419|nr:MULTISPECIES: hypothetical protein [unclassified Mycolicibacterium]MBB3602914.1 hypothetical protein [Mycolicibacterium sp. BK556]MBB3633109.1 hypothetical protein [Mycolicibacterium sp. BK607]